MAVAARRWLRYLHAMPLPATLSRDERRQLARARQLPTTTPVRAARRCLFCLGPLTNGSAVCSDECDEGYWRLVPTLDGESCCRGSDALARP